MECRSYLTLPYLTLPASETRIAVARRAGAFVHSRCANEEAAFENYSESRTEGRVECNNAHNQRW